MSHCKYCVEAKRCVTALYTHGCKGCEQRAIAHVADLRPEERQKHYELIGRTCGPDARREFMKSVMEAWARKHSHLKPT